MAPSGGYAAKGVSIRVTGVGHAGLFIETAAGRVLCDPWVNPAFFGSWFPFPDNSHLDWDALGQADYLCVSHLHRDHFDAELLRRHVRKTTTVLLPDYPTDELEHALAALGFETRLRTNSGVPVQRDGLCITSSPRVAASLRPGTRFAPPISDAAAATTSG